MNTFLKKESGAVYIDWVVLTAAIVGLGFAVAITFGGSHEEPPATEQAN